MGQGDWEGAKKDNPFSQELLSNMKKKKILKKDRFCISYTEESDFYMKQY